MSFKKTELINKIKNIHKIRFKGNKNIKMDANITTPATEETVIKTSFINKENNLNIICSIII